jgi:hypothetical protein
MRSVVVLPHPEGPTSAVNVPAGKFSERFATASTGEPAKRFVTFSSRSATGLSTRAP